jgi:pyridoxine/pyridoxamine 5'-phosphate oxidase
MKQSKKTVSKHPASGAGKSSRKGRTVPSDPPGLQVGLPHVPAWYGLKLRKQYLPWTHARQRSACARNYWICTARPDGRPHSIPVWGLFFDGVFYFGTGRSMRKARNLAQNPAISVHLASGDDVVILEGSVEEVRESDKTTWRNSMQRRRKNTRCRSRRFPARPSSVRFVPG